MTAQHMFNSTTSLVLVIVLLKVYLKGPFLPLYSCCSKSTVLTSVLNNDAVIALFADDVSIFITACKKEDSEAAAQSVVNSVVIWSQQWKLNLIADQSEVCPFSTWSNNSTWNPTIFIGTQKATTYFLGLAPFHSKDGLSCSNPQQT